MLEKQSQELSVTHFGGVVYNRHPFVVTNGYIGPVSKQDLDTLDGVQEEEERGLPPVIFHVDMRSFVLGQTLHNSFFLGPCTGGSVKWDSVVILSADAPSSAL